MDTFFVFALIVLSIVMILWGVNLLIDSSINFSKITGISQMVIGTSIVSIVTTLPALLVCVFSSVGGYPDIAVGTAIGGVLFNFLFILGILFVVKPSSINFNAYKSNIYFYIIALAFLFVSAMSGHLSWIEGCILFLIFVLFYIKNISKSKNVSNIFPPQIKLNKKVLIFDMLLLFVLGGLLTFFGVGILVKNSIKLSNILGVEEGGVGFTIIAVATCVPEIVAAVFAIKRNCVQIVIGDVLGSSILNITLLLSVSVIASGGRLFLGEGVIYTYIPLLLLGLTLFLFPILRYKKSTRVQGVALLILYAIFLIFLFVF